MRVAGGGIYNFNTAASYLVINSIVAGNANGDGVPNDLWGPYSVIGNNVVLFSNSAATVLPEGNPVLTGDPKLGPLGDYGGPTRTMPLRPGSAALDMITQSFAATDQRGNPRGPYGWADLGAYEAGGRTFIVTTRDDEDDGIDQNEVSLREALTEGEAYSTITFDPTAFSTSDHTILLQNGQLEVGYAVTIDASANSASVTIDAQQASRVMKILVGVPTVTLRHLKLTGGNTVPDGNSVSAGRGGGIHTDDTPLTVSDSTVSENTAGDSGGGICAEHAPLTVIDSTVSKNTAVGYGGGGICAINSPLTVSDSTVSKNTAGGYGGGILAVNSVTVTNSTLSENTAGGYGGGINSSEAVILNNSTLSDNSAQNEGGGIWVTDPANVINSIVAGNTAPDFPNIKASSINPDAYSIVGGDPHLAPLGDYGGPTWTMPPLPGSPAIDQGSSMELSDQRGLPRSVDGDGTGGAADDVGAVEYQPSTDLPLFWPLDWDEDGTSYGLEQALGTDPLVADPADPRVFGFAAPFTGGGPLTLSFGINPAAVPGTRWIVRRSPDLSPGSWVEVYRFHVGASGTGITQPDFSATFGSPPLDPDLLFLTDEQPPSPRSFYRLEASPDGPF